MVLIIIDIELIVSIIECKTTLVLFFISACEFIDTTTILTYLSKINFNKYFPGFPWIPRCRKRRQCLFNDGRVLNPADITHCFALISAFLLFLR